MDIEDFHAVFNYSVDFVERMSEIIQIPFLNNVLDSLRLLFSSNACNESSNLCAIPLCYTIILRLPIKQSWFKKGIRIIGDVLDDNCNILSLEDFQENAIYIPTF